MALARIDDDALEVIWELELDTEISRRKICKKIGVKGFDDPRLFQSPFRASIRLDAYQLEPLRKAVLLPCINLFIADDLGLVLAHGGEESAEVALATGCCSAPASRPYRLSSMGSRPARMCSRYRQLS